MEDGEVDSHSPGGSMLDLHSEPYSHFLDDSSVIQNDWDTLIGTQICSHKHICNPTTGPDNTHTHTCEHTHTHTIGSGEDSEKLTKKRRPSGNKEAVRKYREKQKAVKVNLEVRNTELEKENQRIPELQKENARLRRKLKEQGPRQDAVDHLLAENKRLRSLLSNLRRAIDSELEALEDVSYQKLRFTPASKADRNGGGTYLPSGARCAAPAPCFAARPVAHSPHAGRSSDDVEDMEESLGWHMECERVKKVPTCHSPREELEDAEVGADQSTRFGSEVTTPYSNAGTSSSGSKGKPLVCSAKTAVAAARKRHPSSVQMVAAAPGAAVGYQQQQLPVAVPCPVAAVPLPCFSHGPREADHPGGGVVQQQVPQVETWQEDCGLVCGDAETTADSSPPPPPVSLSPPEPVIHSGSTIGDPTLVAPSSKKLRVEPNGSVDLFSSVCFYPDDVNAGAPAGQTAHWNHALLPNVSDDWLDECDFIDGVCQAHLVHAIQNSCFEPQENNEHDSSRSTAVRPAAAQLTSVANQ